MASFHLSAVGIPDSYGDRSLSLWVGENFGSLQPFFVGQPFLGYAAPKSAKREWDESGPKA